MEDHRSIPLDVLRDFARTRSEVSSVRAAAADAGIGRTTLQKFVAGKTTPHPRIRRALALWYLRMRDQAPDIDVARPYANALHTLLSDLPEAARDAAEAEAVALLRDLYARAETERPRWLELLSQPKAPPA